MMPDPFFEYSLSSTPCLERKRDRTAPRRALSAESDAETLRELRLAAIEYRRLLFNLGDRHSIKLHYGACLSMAEIVVALYLHWLDISPENDSSTARERFILSKGHATPGLYVALYQAGFVSDSDFHCYRALDSIFQGHPDRNKTPGVDCTTGSLGQGLGVATGIAWGYRKQGITSHVYCLISDGECNEGSIWESALIAANAKLDNLIVFVDRNKKSSFGSMDGRNDVEPLADKWTAFGWDVSAISGHDFEQITAALAQATSNANGKPKLILANTIKGKGIPYAETHFVRSSSFLEKDQLAESLAALETEESNLQPCPRK